MNERRGDFARFRVEIEKKRSKPHGVQNVTAAVSCFPNGQPLSGRMTTGLAILGLALCAVWLAVGALAGFAAWFIGATFLLVALLFALRVDVVTRGILRRRAKVRDRDPPNVSGD